MKNLVVGIDVGGTNTAYAIVDEIGNILGSANFPTDKHPIFDDYLLELRDGINHLSYKLDFPHKILGIGIGAPNGNYYTGCIDRAANLIWPKEVLPMAEKLKIMFGGIPSVLTNDANAAAIGEMIYGGARGMKNFVVITLGTGLGSGIVVNGDVLYGHDGFAGEFGHTAYARETRACGCGRRGCLETYVSATGMKRTAITLMGTEIMPSSLRSIPFDKLTSKDVAEAATNGDQLALMAFEQTGTILGNALTDLVAITAPEAIFLFGGLAKSGDLILNPTKKAFDKSMLFLWNDKVKILLSDLDERNSAILGASALAWKEINK
jgi:Transcriptional regulator/sugar kinase